MAVLAMAAAASHAICIEAQGSSQQPLRRISSPTGPALGAFSGGCGTRLSWGNRGGSRDAVRKKISVDALEPGMFLDEICGSWVANPFWRSRFLISDPKDIALLRASTVREVWIDVHKGTDVWPSTERAPLTALPDDAPTPPWPVFESRIPVPISDELARARQICAAAKEAVTSMFREARMGNAVDTARIDPLVDAIADSVARNTSALIGLARLKTADDYTYMHSVAVCAMMIALARKLGLDEGSVRSAGVAGLLHDVGKMLVPSTVLNKPGKLTDAEFSVIKGHPSKGHAFLLQASTIDPVALDVCLHHHEKVDGSGYPKGLSGARISLMAKMGAVCDVYDAITSNRPYKAGWDPSESLRQMGQWTSTHFAPDVFQAFARTLGIYPVGSLVQLNSGHIGVVTEQSSSSLMTPVVKLFHVIATGQRVEPFVVDLSSRACKEKIIAREDPAKWNFHDLDALWSGGAA